MDHQEQMPWRVPAKDGGTLGMSPGANVFFQFMYLTNEIRSPKILACPADTKVTVASTWARGSESSVLNPAYRNNAISYFIGLDVKADAPQSILSGDGNLYAAANNQDCDYAMLQTAASLSTEEQSARWTAEVHGGIGNVLFRDGQVKTLDSDALKGALSKTKAAHKANHILLPR
jgi:hypothetical protein